MADPRIVLIHALRESVAPAMAAMESIGVPKRIVAFVMPTGYSFNLDGTTLYLAVASIFAAQAAGDPSAAGDPRVQAMSLQDPKIFLALVCWAVYAFEVLAARRMGYRSAVRRSSPIPAMPIPHSSARLASPRATAAPTVPPPRSPIVSRSPCQPTCAAMG